MKKVNCAEEIEPQSLSMPAEDKHSSSYLSPSYQGKVICISATALSLPNGNSIHFTDECTVKWREQQYYVAHSIAGVTAVFTEAQLTVSLKEERNAHIYIYKLLKVEFSEYVIAVCVLQ